MGEYGGITAALAVLVVSLTTAFAGGALPSLDSKATALVTKAATSKHVSGPEARAAYAKAPYRKPVLRYLYAMAWVSAAGSHGKCHAAAPARPRSEGGRSDGNQTLAQVPRSHCARRTSP